MYTAFAIKVINVQCILFLYNQLMFLELIATKIVGCWAAEWVTLIDRLYCNKYNGSYELALASLLSDMKQLMHAYCYMRWHVSMPYKERYMFLFPFWEALYMHKTTWSAFPEKLKTVTWFTSFGGFAMCQYCENIGYHGVCLHYLLSLPLSLIISLPPSLPLPPFSLPLSCTYMCTRAHTLVVLWMK